MSVEVYSAEAELGQFASSAGYSDLIAAAKDNPVLKAFFNNANAEGPEVNAVAEELKKLAASVSSDDVSDTALALLHCIYGQDLVFISNGTYDKEDDEDETVDKGGPGSGPQGGRHEHPRTSAPPHATTHFQIKSGSRADIVSIQKEVEGHKYSGSGRADSARAVLGMLNTSGHYGSSGGQIPIDTRIAKDDAGTFLGVMQGSSAFGAYEVSTLAVNPKILTGEIQAKGVGTALMVEAAKIASGQELHLVSFDGQSDKFYKAIGMKTGMLGAGSWKWTQAQTKAIAAHGVQKSDDEPVNQNQDEDVFDVEAALEAARKVEDEDGCPLTGKTQREDTVDKGDEFELPSIIIKIDKVHHLVFGFFSIVQIDGKNITDTQGDIIDAETLEESAYSFVLNARKGGEMHEAGSDGQIKGIGRLVESVVFTNEKQEAMLQALHDQGIKDAELDLKCVCWFGGFHIDNEETWDKIVSGELKAFSIGGRGKRASL